MKFKLEALTGKVIFTRTRYATCPVMPIFAFSALKPVPRWELVVLWVCGLIGRCMAHRAASNRVPLRYKLIFLAIVASIVIPVLVERLRF